MSDLKVRKREHYYRLAKKEGYRSRAAFKLLQLNSKYKLIKKGNVVVDLGAAPGGWLQVALQIVGERGFVFGIDLQPVSGFDAPNIKFVRADILDPTTADLVKNNLPRPADVLLSDASPKISGVWDVDHARSVELSYAVLRVGEKVLRPGGNFLVKVFQGSEFQEFLNAVKSCFSFVKVSKPLASRKASAEVYVIGKNFRLSSFSSGSQ